MISVATSKSVSTFVFTFSTIFCNITKHQNMTYWKMIVKTKLLKE